MRSVIIDLRPHGVAGWTWTIFTPAAVTVWRTDETGRGLWRYIVTRSPEARGQPGYSWARYATETEFRLTPDRHKALTRIRRGFACAAPSPELFR